jgi:hypothetical protein
MNGEILSETQLLAAAGELLKQGGYREVSSERLESLKSDKARVYEDQYAIVCLVVFPSWTELRSRWTNVQADFVELLSKYLLRADAKTWDAYLVLLTPATALEQWQEAQEIRQDTTRVRKLVGTGEDLRSLGDVATLVSSLLPIGTAEAVTDKTETIWSLVYESLEKKGVHRDTIQSLVKSYEEQRNIMEALKDSLKTHEIG